MTGRFLALPLALFASICVSCGEQAATSPSSTTVETARSTASAPAADPRATSVVFPEFAGSIRLGDPDVPPRTPGTVRIATYNVENLFDDVDDPELSGDVDDRDETKPTEHLDMVARAIIAADADIIGLQEIESRAALDWFLAGWLPDAGYDHVVSLDAGDRRGIENAIISRYPITEYEVYANLPLKGVHPADASDSRVSPGEPLVMRRGPLRAVVELPEIGPVTFFVVHHKSGGAKTAYWRGAEAFGVGELVTETRETTERPVIVLGDMNSTPRYETHELYHRILGLADLVADAGNESPTHASSRRIDMIYATPDLASKVVDGTGFSLGTPVRPEGADWRTTPPPAGWASDHFIVGADIRTTPSVVPAEK